MGVLRIFGRVVLYRCRACHGEALRGRIGHGRWFPVVPEYTSEDALDRGACSPTVADVYMCAECANEADTLGEFAVQLDERFRVVPWRYTTPPDDGAYDGYDPEDEPEGSSIFTLASPDDEADFSDDDEDEMLEMGNDGDDVGDGPAKWYSDGMDLDLNPDSGYHISTGPDA